MAGSERRDRSKPSRSTGRPGAARRATAGRHEAPTAGKIAAPAETLAVLLEAARAVRERAYAPYSNFRVGAALQAADGTVLVGCNVENATYGLTICAERAALFRGIADGHREFVRVAIAADTAEPTPPCGACRQLLWEFCGDIEVILANVRGVTARYRLSELFPVPFDRRLL